MNTRLVAALALVVIAALAPGQGSQDVKGYIRKDGTYVAPYKRSKADPKKQNNWSSKGNQNPYTGSTGKRDPYKIEAGYKRPSTQKNPYLYKPQPHTGKPKTYGYQPKSYGYKPPTSTFGKPKKTKKGKGFGF